ncbi:MAG: hypothetical protein HZB26_17625 [Candidatus Hydrogenedentes bacterium]|nr:hypothetical protein [Candidatus Hydrogenedentota bacterium]
MTSRERVLTSLRFMEPDRVPYFEQGVASKPASEVLGRKAHTGGGGFRRLGVEAALAGPNAYEQYVEAFFEDWCALVEALDFDVVSLPWAGGGKPARKLDEFTYFFGDLDCAWRVEQFNPASDTFATIDSSLRHQGALQEIASHVQDLAGQHAARSVLTAESFPLLRRLIERFGTRRAIADGPCLAIPMEAAWWEAMLELPEVVQRYLDIQADQACEMIDVMAQMGVDMIWGGGDLASNSGPAYSAAHFRQFMLAPLQRMTAACARHGIPYIFRTDGVIWPIAQELFVESGVRGYGEIDRQAGMKLEDVRRRLPHLILWGNVDCGRTLTFGAQNEVAAETRGCIDAAAAGGGYILGSSNVIHSEIPARNLLAMIEMCREYGRY